MSKNFRSRLQCAHVLNTSYLTPKKLRQNQGRIFFCFWRIWKQDNLLLYFLTFILIQFAVFIHLFFQIHIYNYSKNLFMSLVRYLGMLFWDDITIICDENIAYLFNWKNNCFGPIWSLFSYFSSTNYRDIIPK